MRYRYSSWLVCSWAAWAIACSSNAPSDAVNDTGSNAGGSASVGGSVSGAAGAGTTSTSGGAGGGGMTNAAGAVNAGAAGTGGSGVTSDWWDQAYLRRARLDIDNAAGNETLQDVPVLVTLDATRIGYAEAAADGHDLRFVDAAGKLLSHDVELWANGGTSIVWVKLPELAAKAKTSLFMYWGSANAQALPASAAQAVWSNGYVGVWHFGDDGKDATGKHDSPDVKAPFVAGQVGKAVSFDGATQYFALPGGKYIAALPAVTFSGWVRHQGTQPDGKGVIIGIGDELATGHASWSGVTYSSDNAIIGEANPDDVMRGEAPSGAGTFPNDVWSSFAVVVDIAGKKISDYKNGVPIGDVYTGKWAAAAFKDLASNRASIGAEEDHGPHWFIGSLDEIRLESVARSPAWIAAQAHAQTGDWLTFGSTEQQP